MFEPSTPDTPKTLTRIATETKARYKASTEKLLKKMKKSDFKKKLNNSQIQEIDLINIA